MHQLLHKKWLERIILLGIFALISVVFTSFFISNGHLAIDSDGSFHFSRAEELYQNLKAGKFFTFIATHTFHGSGVGTFLFYPSVFLYPWAGLRFFVDPITAFYIWYGFFMFLTLVISYYSMVKFSKNRLRAFVFALFYTIASYHLYLGVKNYVLGEFIAYTFVPLAMYGFYEVIWGDKDKWPVLAIGTTTLLYSHLLSVAMAVGVMFVLFVVGLVAKTKLTWGRVGALLKSVALAIILGSWVIFPFITDYLKVKLGGPKPGFTWFLPVTDLWNASLENFASNRGVGLALIITAVIGWYFVRNSKRELCIYFLGIFFLFAVTNIFPYTALLKYNVFTLLQTIQFPYRFLTYASFFLAVVLSQIVASSLENISNYHKGLLTFGITILAFCLYVNAITPMLERIWDSTNQVKLQKSQDQLASVPSGAVLDKENYQALFSYVILYGETDYYHKQAYSDNNIANNEFAKSIVAHEVKIGSKTKVIVPKVAPNTLTYTVKTTKTTTVDLPVISYPSDVVYVNGKKVSFTTSQRGTIKVNVSKGTNKIRIQYQMSPIFYFFFVISVLGWLSLAVFWFVKDFNFKKPMHQNAIF